MPGLQCHIRMSIRFLVLFSLIGVYGLLGGCASSIPEQIRNAPEINPAPDEVRTNVSRFAGLTVRWGGVIASVDNQADETRIEIVSRDLSRSGRPHKQDFSAGRFIAKIAGFLDPAVFSKQREITVTGEVEKLEQHRIGQFQYTYPVVKVDQYQLWQALPPPSRYHYQPFWYDPWYHPYRWHHPYRYGHPHTLRY